MSNTTTETDAANFRDRITDAVRAEADAHSCMYQEGIDVDAMVAAVLAVHPAGTCDASMPSMVGDPLGPCVLRYGHDGPVHRGANGAQWWLRADAAAEPTDDLAITPYLVVHRYRTDQGDWAWSWRCWGDGPCDGHLALDLSNRAYAERNARRHLTEAHATPEPVKEG